MLMDKEKIKAELVDKSNNILAKYAEKDIVESVSVMNMSAKTVFLGSLRIYNEDVVSDIKKDLKKALRERVNLWWYCNEWFDIYDYDTNKKIDEKLYLEYKPLPLDIYHTTRTLYYSEEEGEIVDDKPRFGYFET